MKKEKYLKQNSSISKNSKIDKNVKLVGECVIEDGVVITGDCYIENSIIRSGCDIKSSYIISSEVGKNSTVGPYAHIKQNSKIGENCRIGNFVEIKNSTLGNFTKCAHLSYVGDSSIGERVNIGCGVVFANYDGKKKHRCCVGNDVFIGCNCNIIAPRTIDDNCFIAAGTTVTKDLPKNFFCIGRAVDEQKERKN